MVLMCSLCLRPWREEGRVEAAATEDEDTGTWAEGELKEFSAERVSSPGEETGDSDSGEGEWSLEAPGDTRGSLRL